MMNQVKTHVVFSFLISILFVKQSEELGLEDCWSSVNIIHGEKCFETIITQKTYQNAVRTCSLKGGEIAMMKTSTIQALISENFKKKGYSTNYWVGVNDIRSEKSFEYADGTSLTSFAPWANGEPNGNSYRDEDCVKITSNEQWNDVECGTERYFACEYKSDPCRIQSVRIPHAEYQSCYTSNHLKFRDSLFVKCHKGYVLVGPNNVTCLANSEWSPFPHCVQGCPSPKQLSHATLLNLKEAYAIGSQVIYLCNDGYVTNRQQRSHSRLTCGLNSKWLPETTGCSLEEKYTIGTMEVEPETSISIPCITFNVDNGSGDNFTKNNLSYLWLKNSEYITNTKLDYSIDVNGTLTINNMSADAVGDYICFRDDEHLTPGAMDFVLQLKPEVCPPNLNQTEILELKEGSSLVLRCPHTSLNHEFTWFKDGHQYYVRNSDQTMFPDGTLYTKSLQYTDQGIYTCRMLVRNTLCEQNYTTKVIVLASSANICGKVEPEYPHPWAVYLWKKDEIAPFCYGALINERWVVTSANCLAGFNRKRSLNLFVRFGYQETDSITNSHVTEIEVLTVKIHPKFSKKRYVNDVGLVQLRNPVQFTRFVRPICLTEDDLTLKQPCDRSPSIKGTVVGWGPLERDDYDDFPAMLNETMSIVDRRDSCFTTDHSYFEQVICMKKTVGTNTTLAGDAGSPLEVFWEDRYYLLGIYSWGDRATLLGDNDYFTKISSYVFWMNSFNEGSNSEIV